MPMLIQCPYRWLQVWVDVTTQLHAHTQDPSPIGFTIVFDVLLLVFYLVFRAIRLAPRSREESAE